MGIVKLIFQKTHQKIIVVTGFVTQKKRIVEIVQKIVGIVFQFVVMKFVIFGGVLMKE